MDDQQKTMKTVYTVVERTKGDGVAKSYWTRIGVGFVNRDGSMNLHLDCIPINGKLQVRDWEPPERRFDGNGVGGGNGSGAMRPRSPAPGAGDSLI